MKLKIENYDTLKSEFCWGSVNWRINLIEETHTQYHFELKNNTGKVIDIQLERDQVSGNNLSDYQYEIWCWSSYQPSGKPLREFIYYHQVKDKRLFSSVITTMIKKWTNV
jgi:hypothetical protein